MSKHQIIYTSCMRGINGVNDGQQIYSYDAAFKNSGSDDVKSLFTYQVPSLKPGEVMTEELATTMPKAFMYRRLSNGSCAIVLNTYLGRDYMGGAGRFGNHLSHAIVCDEDDMNDYPCEFYGGELLRSHMEFSEVNSPDRPPYLPEPVLNKGYRVDIDSVIDFLSINGRMEIFKKMLSAMLSFESARKRVVICDAPENIIMWIAALHYILPIKVARNVNFTTYEFDPSLSVSQICGVIPNGSRYAANNAASHFTFDFIYNIFPEIEAEGEFFDFIDMSMSLSYESLRDFHEFVSTRLDYSKADEQYYHTYALYCLFSDGLENLSLESFKKAVQVSRDHATDTEKMELIKKLLNEKDFILSAEEEYALEVIKVILEKLAWFSENSQELIKKVIVEKAIASLTSTVATESDFIKFYTTLEQLCREFKISIPYELMKDANRDALFSSMSNDNTAWKWEFIVAVLCDYILLKPIPADQLSMDFPIGNLIGGIIMSVFSIDVNRGFSLLTKIIDKFSTEWKYLANMALNMEGILYDVQNTDRITAALWQYFYQAVGKKQSGNRQNIYSFFLLYDRYEQVFGIYCELLAEARSTKEARELFVEQVQLSNVKYTQNYVLKIFDLYYDYLMTNKDVDTISTKRELLQIVIQKGLSPSFVGELIDSVLLDNPLTTPSKENEKLKTVLFDYYLKQKCKPLSGRLLLLVSGMVLSEVKNKQDLDEAMRHLAKITSNEKIDLLGSDRNSEKFLDWVVPPIFAASESSDDLIASYDLFKLSRSSFDFFINICAKEAVKESKGDKEFYSVLVFLDFIFSIGNVDKKEVGKVFSKFNKQKLDGIDTAVKTEFQKKKSYLLQWDEIREVAASTNPFLNSLGNLFKKKGN